uniref:uncharacterized protein isoform X3 n=2 Tax=Myxine glutinosa TaxID=7769 RepID=UPI00358DE085
MTVNQLYQFCISMLTVMDRDPPICTHDPNSSDSKSVSDGGNTGGPGGVRGICGFRILDVQKLRDGGDGTDQEPDPTVVVKVEPEPTGGFPSPDLNEEVKVKLELGENCSSQDPIVVMKVKPEPAGGFPSPDLNEEVKVKLELGENCSSQDETGQVIPGYFHGNVPQMLNITRMKEEPCEDSLTTESTFSGCTGFRKTICGW